MIFVLGPVESTKLKSKFIFSFGITTKWDVHFRSFCQSIAFEILRFPWTKPHFTVWYTVAIFLDHVVLFLQILTSRFCQMRSMKVISITCGMWWLICQYWCYSLSLFSYSSVSNLNFDGKFLHILIWNFNNLCNCL